jgi:hypothetical protein
MNSQKSESVSLYYSKSRKIDLGKWKMQYFSEKKDQEYNPYEITEIQSYNPMYSVFFELNEKNYNKISLNHPMHINDLQSVIDTKNQKIINQNVFIKFSPLLDPIHTLIGKYENNTPSPLEEIFESVITQNIIKNKYINKLTNPFNASYVDCFFNYLSSQLKNTYSFENGIDFYGSYVGIQKEFKMNITDDYEYLQDSEFFVDNENKTYVIKSETLKEGNVISSELSDKYPVSSPMQNMNSHKNKPKICISNDIIESLEEDVLSIISYPDGENNSEKNGEKNGEKDDISLVYEKENISNNSSMASSSSSDNSVINDSSSEREDEEDEDDEDNWSDVTSDKMGIPDSSSEDDDEDDTNIYAYMKDFPIQMICLEQCDGTFDELLEKKIITENEISSALTQVIMTLITYQKAFQFTHNDLHTNNIVYKNIEQEWIEYTYKQKKYRVPTYGRIFKIIDYGRSIYRFQDKFICSDSFAPSGDANTQYNIEPFFNNKKPRLEPNPSFDLCRLGCSIYDFVFENDDNIKDITKCSELQQTIMRWCTDDYGKNILYKKNGEERYPNFKLYKMIARIVHKHVPENQLLFSYFSQYLDDERKERRENKTLKIDIDKIPKSYS